MKRMFIVAVALLSSLLLPGQGVYQLWGTTYMGGKDNLGVIYSMDAKAGNFHLRHEFEITAKGNFPKYTRLTEYKGDFYGLTSEGGNYDAGVLFKWNPVTNAYIDLVDFHDSIGSNPTGSLTLFENKLYGMTSTGGGADYGGVIFEYDLTTNVYSKKLDFTWSSGLTPYGSLTLKGTRFYGMTSDVYFGAGVIFEWDPRTNVYEKKITFNGENGYRPYGDLTLFNDKFYGTAGYDLFEWDPVTNVYTHNTYDESGGSAGNLTLYAGKFYGTSTNGGVNGQGAIFEWDPVKNIVATKMHFAGEYTTTGYMPTGSLTLMGSKFYGMTTGGFGLIYEWDPATNVFTNRIDFQHRGGGSPLGGLTLSGGKFYGMNLNTIFEWDPVNNRYTKKIDFNKPLNGSYPISKLTQHNGKLYGLTSYGGEGDQGIIFELDPENNLFIEKKDFIELAPAFGPPEREGWFLDSGKFIGFTNETGGYTGGTMYEWDLTLNDFKKITNLGVANGFVPNSLTRKDGKYYGTTLLGGLYDRGVIFEWDSASNVYTKKIDFDGINGGNPSGGLIFDHGRFYGTTHSGGANGAGVIFEWDPLSNTYSKKIDLIEKNGSEPNGMTLYKNKFYGVAHIVNIGRYGVIFEWDRATNTYTKKIDLDDYVLGGLTLSGEKLYGVTDNTIFEYDPETNLYTVRKLLDPTGKEGSSANGHDLNLVAAPVAKGMPGNCLNLPSVTIDNSNNNKWVSFTDTLGNAVAEINANGNNLGVVSASLFVNKAAARQDGNKRLYLDRNIKIIPQMQPKTPVNIRLYIKNAEFLALKNARNSSGQSSGIDSIQDLEINAVGTNCSAAVSSIKNPLATTVGTWEGDYVLSATITSFSSFYFAGKLPCRPPVITHVSANPSTLWPPNHKMKNVFINYTVKSDCCPVTSSLSVKSNEPLTGTGRGDITPDWVILDNHHLQLRAERAGKGKGRIYTITITSKDAYGNLSTGTTEVTVPHDICRSYSKGANNPGDNEGFIDANGDYIDQLFDCRVMPNPSSQYFTLEMESVSDEKVEVNLLDISGRLIKKHNLLKNKSLRFGDDLLPGIYLLEMKQGAQHKLVKVVKQ